ncbi:MAG: hypothetical protein MJ230_01580 [bacterium]|nr:hypothetical protein [bacterium]
MLTDSRILRLPDYYAKSEESNNNKILSIFGEKHLTAKSDIIESAESLDIYSAFGETLDRYGEIYDEKRVKGMNDDKYRLMILLKIQRMIAGCDFDSIINSISIIFNCEKDKIHIENNNNPARIDIVDLPLAVIQKSGFDYDFTVEIISKLLPICVEINSINITGTFEFGETETEYDELKGFGNEEQSIGGYFGEFKTL